MLTTYGESKIKQSKNFPEILVFVFQLSGLFLITHFAF